VIAGLVLAAGASRRLGTTKQVLPLGGRPLLSWALEAVRAAAPSLVVVVLGHDAERIQREVALDGIQVVLNPRYAEGLSTSLQAGLRALPADVSAALVATGDQPFITAAHLSSLLAAHAATAMPIVATGYGDHAGVPMLLARSVWPLVDDLHGDRGAQPLLRGHPELVAQVAATDAAMALDVDTPEAYDAVRARVHMDGSPTCYCGPGLRLRSDS
jgi:molybdenum cofactor cytidylyltransferase